MLENQQPLFLPLVMIIILVLRPFHISYADVGTAAQYSSPYLPTACYGSDSTQFPTSNLFGAAGEGIWDNGAGCGRQYEVRCISAFKAGTCIPDQIILITILDYSASLSSDPSAPSTTMVLSQSAFATIANSTASSINIEFQPV